MKLRVSKQRISTTMLISMTDVIFLLLLFLLIGSNFVSQTGLPIKLPGSSTAVRQSSPTLLITFYGDGRLFFMDKPITMEELKTILGQKYQNPEQIVRIAIEKQVPVQKLINLMDIVRSVGYERIFVATTAVENK
ncbi:MAG: biopolymer transporter ExbD [Candidatus Cloacimonas sp.]|jgi:biopolymer transport protein ExbD|nr:biopolymer transporter ExbD [Candidatus Cloacimonas sp.]HNW25006.1 biopolymer transporter ExbD [Candidatus Cloacimonas sp.]HNX03555.1 biopolymer transporter ExbD [Candidatus Cloacimonas sp.]HPS60266.1 biopolymer transporter ExbD [Candidatus Cloacimonas sp.]